MGYEIKLDEHACLLISLKGHVSAVDLLGSLREATRLVRAQAAPPHHSVWDARLVTGLDVGADVLPALDEMMKELEASMGEGRSATVMNLGQINPLLLTQLLSARAPQGKRERAQFTEYDAAQDWIRLA